LSSAFFSSSDTGFITVVLTLSLASAETGAFAAVEFGLVAIGATTGLLDPFVTGLATFALVDASCRLGAVVLDARVEGLSARLSTTVEDSSLGGLAALRLAFIDDILLETPLRVGRFGASLPPERAVSLSESPVVDFGRVALDGGLLGGLFNVLPVSRVDVVDDRNDGVEDAAVEDRVGPVARDTVGFVTVLAVVLPSLGVTRPRSPIGVALDAFSFESMIACPALQIADSVKRTFKKCRTLQLSRGLQCSWSTCLL